MSGRLTRIETQSVQVYRIDPQLDLDADLARVRTLALLMDANFEVAGFKFGWDAILGLVPGVGDALSAVVGMYPIYIARKHGFGRTVAARMALNLFADWAIGVVPLIGDVFDIAFRSNLKNLKLLERAAGSRISSRR